MKTKDSQIQPFKRLPTGIPGMDELMHGGFLRGGIYLIMGPPGSGKTILSNQIGFHHVSRGGRALYVSLLSEGHGRLFGHLKPLAFFDESAIASSFNFISAYQTLEKEGLDGLLRSLAHLVRQYKADLLFLDGVASAEELAKSPVSFKKFVHDLNTVLSTSGCTAMLLSSFGENLGHPEHTMVDGIVSLSDLQDGLRSVKMIEVKKLRGSGHIRGRHVFDISDRGITVYPRIESLWKPENIDFGKRAKMELLKTGVAKLDGLLDGGLFCGSVTSILGPAGAGKTLLGNQFLAEGAKKGESGLYFGFYEHPVRMIRKMERINVALGKHVDSKKLELMWRPPLEHSIDEIGGQIIENVRKRKVKRLFIDGIAGLQDGMIEESRMCRALSALMNVLRDEGVTTCFTEETELFASEISTPISDHSAITDNIIYLRHIELNSEFVNVISVIKSRETSASGAIHRFDITEKGIVIGKKFEALQGVVTGTPKPTKTKRGLF